MALTSVLLIAPLLAVAAPLLARGLGRWIAVPVVVFELLLGIVAGPSVLGWAQPSDLVALLADLGLAMLFFMAGTEIEVDALRGRTGRRAAGGWVLSLAIGVAIGWLIAPGEGAIIIGVALCSTALGTLIPILRDAGELRTPFGRSVSAVGAVGEFGPLIAISVLLGTRDPGVASLVLAGFFVVAALAVWASIAIPRGALHRAVTASLHTSGQFAIRVLLLLLLALLTLSIVLDLDMLLGAFTAGVVWRLLLRDAPTPTREAVESKVEALAFGFLIPLFFVYTGITFDLSSLMAQPVLLLFVPVVLVALLVARGLPASLAAPAGSSWRGKASVGLMGATGLPIIVAVTAIGVEADVLAPAAASVLVAGGMLSVLVLPLIAMAIRPRVGQGASSSVVSR